MPTFTIDSRIFYLLIAVVLMTIVSGTLFSRAYVTDQKYNEAMAFIDQKNKEIEDLKIIKDSLDKEVFRFELALQAATSGLNNQREVVRRALENTGAYLDSIPSNQFDSIQNAYLERIRSGTTN